MTTKTNAKRKNVRTSKTLKGATVAHTEEAQPKGRGKPSSYTKEIGATIRQLFDKGMRAPAMVAVLKEKGIALCAASIRTYGTLHCGITWPRGRTASDGSLPVQSGALQLTAPKATQKAKAPLKAAKAPDARTAKGTAPKARKRPSKAPTVEPVSVDAPQAA